MKTIIRKSLLVALMLGTLSSYATGTTLVDEKGTGKEVEIRTVKKGQILYIKNSEGKVLHEKTIEINGTFEKAFDFSSLRNGYYTLEVNKDFQIEVIPFTVIAKKATFYTQEEKTIFKPVIRTRDNRVMVSKLAFEEAQMHVTIYFEGDIIFKEKVEGENVLKRVYQLRKDIKGDYKVVMKANDRTYINEFSL